MITIDKSSQGIVWHIYKKFLNVNIIIKSQTLLASYCLQQSICNFIKGNK